MPKEQADRPKWTDKCPFCFKDEKEREANGRFHCANCKAQFFGEEDELDKRSRFTGINRPYDTRKFPRK